MLSALILHSKKFIFRWMKWDCFSHLAKCCNTIYRPYFTFHIFEERAVASLISTFWISISSVRNICIMFKSYIYYDWIWSSFTAAFLWSIVRNRTTMMVILKTKVIRFTLVFREIHIQYMKWSYFSRIDKYCVIIICPYSHI